MAEIIDKEHWHTCKLCSRNIKDLAKVYGGNGVYYTTVFAKHLLHEHNISTGEYFDLCPETQGPVCACGKCRKKCEIAGRGNSNWWWRKYACGRNEGMQKWSEEAKVTRRGPGNPMYQKTPWNHGETKETNITLKRSGEKRLGQKMSVEAKAKMSRSAKKRLVHGHTGHKHTPETIEKLRENTIRLHRDGAFKHTKTGPHLEMQSILEKLSIVFEEEVRAGHFNFDFYLPEYSIYIEVDGDYWHSNPIRYKDGPKSKAQKINASRDASKNKYCRTKGMKLIRVWEYRLNNAKEEVECNLLKSLKSQNWDQVPVWI